LFNALQVIDGYFVHYFAPSGLQPVNKNVLFIIDTSGSMIGSKIAQTKDAMNTILDDLREGDMFNIIKFSGIASSWSTAVREATPENIRDAKEYVKDIEVDGGKRNC
jgi:Mg-chelatase subunit ChlD